jgi:hypothetical protein
MRLLSIAANQTEVEFGNDISVFFSYRTPVAAFIPGLGYVKTSKKFSQTTSKHINKWLEGETATEVDQDYINNLVGAGEREPEWWEVQ